MEELDKRIYNFVSKLNTVENINRINIPILDDFKIVKNEITKDSNVILVATKGNTVEQFLTEGTIPEEVSLDEKIKEIISNIDKQIKNNPLYKNKKYMELYGEYENKDFNFKIYIQDVLTGTITSTSFIRQINAYFIEPIGREFCQISLAAGRYKKSNEFKTLDEIKNIKEDEINSSLYKSLITLLDNINYKEK